MSLMGQRFSVNRHPFCEIYVNQEKPSTPASALPTWFNKAKQLYIELYKERTIWYPIFSRRYYGRNNVHQARRTLEEVAVMCKNRTALSLASRTSPNSLDTGCFLTVEYFMAVLPLLPGTFHFLCYPFIVSVFADKTFETEALPSFWRSNSNNQSPRSVTQEVFVRSKRSGSQIYLFLKGNATASDGNFYKFEGVRRLGTVQFSKSGAALKMDSTSKSLVLDFAQCDRAEQEVAAPTASQVASFYSRAHKSTKGDGLIYMVMELSNENAIGESSFQVKKPSQRKSKAPISDQFPIQRFLFVNDCKEESPSSSRSSSGYGSLPDCPSDSRSHLYSDCNRPNSCVVCGSMFESSEELMLHLFTRDTKDPTLVTVCLTRRLTVSPVNATKRTLQMKRSQMGVRAPQTKIRRQKPSTQSCLPCNMPRYEALPGSLHGVETPIDFFNQMNERRIRDFSDVREEEKYMMIAWNKFANHRQNRSITERSGSAILKEFTRQHADDIVGNGGQRLLTYLAHATVKYMHKEVDTNAIKDSLLILLDHQQKTNGTRPTHSSPVKRKKPSKSK